MDGLSGPSLLCKGGGGGREIYFLITVSTAFSRLESLVLVVYVQYNTTWPSLYCTSPQVDWTLPVLVPLYGSLDRARKWSSTPDPKRLGAFMFGVPFLPLGRA